MHNIAACEEKIGEIAKADLAKRLGVDVDSIAVVSRERVEWPDTSLGNPKPSMVYAQVITPGYRLILEADGQTYTHLLT